MNLPAREKFVALMREAVVGGTLAKLTLGKPAGADKTLKNLFVRPVALKSGPRLAFVWRHKTRDITKKFAAEEALTLLESMIGTEFLDAHLFTATINVQLEMGGGAPRIRSKETAPRSTAAAGNDRTKTRVISEGVPWLRALGVTDESGRPLAPMTDKFRQIEKFAEILGHLVKDSPLEKGPVRVFDMGCGKGYLTFATSELLGDRGTVCGVEARPDLVELCSGVAASQGLSGRLSFRTGSISTTEIGEADVLIALHACDTATDDAIAKGVKAGASLIVVAPCCQKEIRPQIVPPPVLAGVLRNGIFLERQAEFVTDALRAMLLEWAGYTTRVMEFISTEHTAKNTMITAVGGRPKGAKDEADRIRTFAAFYGVRHHALAKQLGFDLR